MNITIPLYKFGGIFSKKTGIIPFSDDILYIRMRLKKSTDSFFFLDPTGDFPSSVTGNIAIKSVYLSLARSRIDEIN